MSVLTNLGHAALAEAIEANGAKFLLDLGRAGGGEERHDDLDWVIGGSPIDYHNAIYGARLAKANADAGIAASLEALKRRKVPGAWHVGPSMQPRDLEKRLERAGFTYAGDDYGMAADLSIVPEAVRVPDGFAIQRVETQAELDSWVHVLGGGFGEGPVEARWVGDMYACLGLDHPEWHHFLGTFEGKPVSTATMLYGAGVAGLYFIYTDPDYRRRGIGAAMTVVPLKQAADDGYKAAVLGASTMGRPVYERLGFREYYRIGIFEWWPEA